MEKTSKPYSSFRTLATAIVLSTLVSIAAMIYLVTTAAPEGDARVPYILAYAIPFGVAGALLGATGIIGINDVEKEWKRIMLLVSGLLSTSFGIVIGVFSFVFWNNVVIGVCLIGVGLCVTALDVIAFLNRKKN